MEFAEWLRQRLQGNSAASVLSRVRRLERAFGALKAHYDADHLEGLLLSLSGRRLTGILINGDQVAGAASLANAVRLFRGYCDEKNGRQLPRAASLRPVTPSPAPRRSMSLERNAPHGAVVLSEQVAQMGLSLIDLVAGCSYWAHPSIVAELRGIEPDAVWFPNTRRKRRNEKRGEVVNGIVLDDNSKANQAIKLAVFGAHKVPGYNACHIWPKTCYDPRYHTAIPNLVLLPAALASLTDHDEDVGEALRARARDLYGWWPQGEVDPLGSAAVGVAPWRPFESNVSPHVLAVLRRRMERRP